MYFVRQSTNQIIRPIRNESVDLGSSQGLSYVAHIMFSNACTGMNSTRYLVPGYQVLEYQYRSEYLGHTENVLIHIELNF